MKISKENLKKSRVKFTLEVEPKELVGYFRTTYEKLAKDVKIDGFRAGKAPYKMIEGVVGYNRLLGEGLDEAINMSYRLAIGQEKIYPVSTPKVEIKKSPGFSLDETAIVDSLVFEIEVDVMPQVELKDFSKAKIKPVEKRKAEDKEVEKILNQLMKQKATFKNRDNKILKGDRVDITYDGYIKNVKIDRMCSKNHPLIIGEGTLIPGFEDQLIGMKKGEKKSFEIKFPKDYHDKEIAGNLAKFEVTLNDAKEVVMPKLDKDFAKQFGHPSIEKLKTEIKKSLEKEIEKEYKDKVETAVLEKMLEYIKTELPEGLIEQEVERIFSAYKNQIEQYGVKFDQYLANSKKTEDELKKDMRKQAEKNVKVGLMLGKIIEQQKIDSKNESAGKKALDYLVSKLS